MRFFASALVLLAFLTPRPAIAATDRQVAYCAGILGGTLLGFTLAVALKGCEQAPNGAAPTVPLVEPAKAEKAPLDRDGLELAVLELELAAALEAGKPVADQQKSIDRVLRSRAANGPRGDYERAYDELAALERRIGELERELAAIRAKLAGNARGDEAALLRAREKRVLLLLRYDRALLVDRLKIAAGQNRSVNGREVTLTPEQLLAWKNALTLRVADLRAELRMANLPTKRLREIEEELADIEKTADAIEAKLPRAPTEGPTTIK